MIAADPVNWNLAVLQEIGPVQDGSAIFEIRLKPGEIAALQDHHPQIISVSLPSWRYRLQCPVLADPVMDEIVQDIESPVNVAQYIDNSSVPHGSSLSPERD